MDPTNRTLDSMIQVSHPSQIGDIVESQSQYQYQTQGEDWEGRPSKRRGVTDDPISIEDDEGDEDDDGNGNVVEEVQGGSGSNGMWTTKTTEVPESECDFTSILELRDEVRKRGNSGEHTPHVPRPTTQASRPSPQPPFRVTYAVSFTDHGSRREVKRRKS